MKVTTLCYPIINNQILLAMKKRGFGVGKWNGPGGKLQGSETIEQACKREFFEETGARIKKMEHRGVVEFYYDQKSDWNQRCHIYVATEIFGEPQETEEMLPKWFSLNNIPYQSMWNDDPLWLPGVIDGGQADIRIYFDTDLNIYKHESII